MQINRTQYRSHRGSFPGDIALMVKLYQALSHMIAITVPELLPAVSGKQLMV